MQKELNPIVTNAIERFYSWLKLINVKEKESIMNIDIYNCKKVELLHDSGHKVSDEILDLFCETLLNSMHYSFSFRQEERKAIEALEKTY